MHLEICVEDRSGARLIEAIMPKLVGEQALDHTWRVHPYRGVGKLPRGLRPGTDAKKRILLDQLPRLLRGFTKTPGIDAVVVIVDTDNRECREFLQELKNCARGARAEDKALFRLAIEEVEAWYLGDREALLRAFPQARKPILDRYEQDSICGTWELLADAIHPGGSAAINKVGWQLAGQLKTQWAERIAIHMEPDRNLSPSFCKFRDGLRRLTQRILA